MRAEPATQTSAAKSACREDDPGAPGCVPTRAKTKIRDDHGFSLIEVMISALLTAVIAIGVLTGFEAAANTANNNRVHDQATLLAAESQEELRSDPASALIALVNNPHSFSRTVGRQAFTIVQEAKPNKGEGDIGCGDASSKSGHEASENFEVRSHVTWSANKSKEVEQSTLITPPEGSALTVEVDEVSGPPAERPVEDATVIADGVTATTSREGCAIFTALPVKLVNVSVTKSGYVTPSGQPQYTKEEIVLAPNIITREPVTLGEAGALTAGFTYNKGTETATSDTFVAYNKMMEAATDFILGGTHSTTSKETYDATADTPFDIFPFPEEQWEVYAGDCPADSPKTVTSNKIDAPTVLARGGQNITVPDVPMAYVTLEIYTGTTKKQESLASTEYPVTITNTSCAGETPSNETTTTATDVSEQMTTKSGALKDPFQPFGAYTLCLYEAKKEKAYKTERYELTTETPKVIKIDLEGTGSGTSSTAGSDITVETKQKTNTC